MRTITIEIDTEDPYLTDTLNEILGALPISQVADWRYCSSDDPANHQGDTCPIHEAVDADLRGPAKADPA